MGGRVYFKFLGEGPRMVGIDWGVIIGLGDNPSMLFSTRGRSLSFGRGGLQIPFKIDEILVILDEVGDDSFLGILLLGFFFKGSRVIFLSIQMNIKIFYFILWIACTWSFSGLLITISQVCEKFMYIISHLTSSWYDFPIENKSKQSSLK